MPRTHCSAISIFLATALLGTPGFCDPITVKKDVTYGTGGETELQLDLAQPTGEGPFPAVVFIHGGGWRGGNRHTYDQQIREAAERGYVAATITYRLMEVGENGPKQAGAEPNFPAQCHDAKAAIRWLRAHADEYNVDPDRIGVTGGSAGGYLSLLIGLSDAEAGLEGEGGNPDRSSRVHAVVNFYGPTEMATCYAKSSVAWVLRLFMGGRPDEAPETYVKASPITYVSSDDPPVLTLHGDQDKLVPVAQAKKLDEAMNAAGAPHELVILEGQGHGFGGKAQEKAMKATWDFFDRHLKQ